MKATYYKNGLVYQESSSEEEEGGGGGLLSSEVIEIDDDDDDDVIAVGFRKSGSFQLQFHCYYNNKNQVVKYLLFFIMFQWFLQSRLALLAKTQR